MVVAASSGTVVAANVGSVSVDAPHSRGRTATRATAIFARRGHDAADERPRNAVACRDQGDDGEGPHRHRTARARARNR